MTKNSLMKMFSIPPGTNLDRIEILNDKGLLVFRRKKRKRKK